MSAFPRTCRGNPHASRESGLLNRSANEVSSPKSEDPADRAAPFGAGAGGLKSERAGAEAGRQPTPLLLASLASAVKKVLPAQAGLPVLPWHELVEVSIVVQHLLSLLYGPARPEYPAGRVSVVPERVGEAAMVCEADVGVDCSSEDDGAAGLAGVKAEVAHLVGVAGAGQEVAENG